MSFEPNFFTTLIGSIPYNNTAETCKKIIETIDLPIWPQMVKLGFRENMYTQYGAVLPSIVIDGANEKITSIHLKISLQIWKFSTFRIWKEIMITLVSPAITQMDSFTRWNNSAKRPVANTPA